MVDYSKWDHIGDDDDDDDNDKKYPHVYINDGKTRDIPWAPPPASVQTSKKHDDDDEMCRNGSISKIHGVLWSQTKDDVTLHKLLDNHTIRAKHLSISIASKHVKCVNKTNADTILDMELSYEVYSDDDILGCWEIVTMNDRRYLKIMLKKKSPIPNLIFWWKRVCVDDEDEIDTTTIKDRKKDKSVGKIATLLNK